MCNTYCVQLVTEHAVCFSRVLGGGVGVKTLLPLLGYYNYVYSCTFGPTQ